MVVSVTLSRGAIRMSRRKVLVKRLAAIHDLGSMDVLCTDKTGTLTEARIRLEQHLDSAGPRQRAASSQLAYLNSRFQSGLKSPLDEAILRHEEVDVSGFGEARRDPVRFRAPLRLRPGAAGTERLRFSSSRARSRTSCGCRRGYEDSAEVRPLDDAARGRA